MMIRLFFWLKSLMNSYPYSKWVIKPLYRVIGWLYCSQIPVQCRIGKMPKFMHGLYGIFIAGGGNYW